MEFDTIIALVIDFVFLVNALLDLAEVVKFNSDLVVVVMTTINLTLLITELKGIPRWYSNLQVWKILIVDSLLLILSSLELAHTEIYLYNSSLALVFITSYILISIIVKEVLRNSDEHRELLPS